MATMLGFVATDARVSAAARSSAAVAHAARALVQLHHRRRRHVDQRLVHADRDRAARACARSPMRASAAYAALARRGHRRGRASSRRRSCATARARPSSSPSASRAGASDEECRKVAYAIAHSPLVKTAFFASDPNLGRILAAIGYAGIADLDVGQGRSVPRRRAGGEERRPRPRATEEATASA